MLSWFCGGKTRRPAKIFKIILVREVNPVVSDRCACAQHIVGWTLSRKCPASLHPHLDWWLDEGNVLRGQFLHPLQHALQVFTDASNEGWGAHLGESTARGVWSEPEGKLHINYLELEAVFLALKSFEHLCRDQFYCIK